MYCNYQDREELEDDLYGEEGDSDGSEVNSEVEFHLYSQLHYASETRAVNGEDLQDEERERSVSADPEQSKDGLQEQQALKQALLKLDNVKKGKTNAKSLRSSAKLEEVIVIDSGTDIIHSEDDNEGVCTLKGQSSKKVLLSSTPAQQTRAKRTRSPSLDSVVLVNSESESEESESDSSDESDDNSDILETWMILGQGKDVEDHSISLNLEGHSSNSTDGDEAENGNWLVSSKDMATRIYNQDKSKFVRPLARRDSNRYYCDKDVTCKNCNKTGHLSKTCPSPSKVLSCSLCGTPGHLMNCCPNRHCNNCGMPGHLYEACSDKAYWHKKCHRCGMTGHFFDVCPEIWRQYHLTTRKGPPQPAEEEDQGRTPAYCYNCSRRGHFGHACTQRRMYNGTYPSTPFINHYDTPVDFKQREHRMKWKVKELEEAGLLGTTSKPPGTPGPPKKRQRTAHDYKKNQQQENTNNYPSSTRAPTPGSSFTPTHTRFGEAGPVQTTPRRPAVIFKTKMSAKLKPTPVSGAAKQWKPKRDVPATKAAPSTFYEEECFPRGREERAPKKSRNRNKKNPNRLNWGGSTEARTSPFKRESYTPEQLYGGRGAAKEKGKRAGWKKKRLSKGGGADIYPTDENLFTIKQRKGKRKQ